MRTFIVTLLIGTVFISCTKHSETMESYVVEITTSHYKDTVDASDFWKEDALVDANYTSKQPGYISRESGYSPETNEVVVVVRWKTIADADASMKKFMEDASVTRFANMINETTMHMSRYKIQQ